MVNKDKREIYMKFKKLVQMMLVCSVVLSCVCMGVGAVEATERRATGKFSMDIAADTMVKANSSFPLEVGEVVTIKASYSPFSASVDFGVIAPDGFFYYVNVKDGSIDQGIEVEQPGHYTLAVRNNSSNRISVSGYVNY